MIDQTTPIATAYRTAHEVVGRMRSRPVGGVMPRMPPPGSGSGGARIGGVHTGRSGCTLRIPRILSRRGPIYRP